MSESEAINTNIKFLMDDMELKAIAMLCTAGCSIIMATALGQGGDPKSLTRAIEHEIDKIIKETIERKMLRKEFHKPVVNTIETRMAMFGVDPINECLNLFYELYFLRYILNQVITNTPSLKELINEEVFKNGRLFANQEMKVKFPKVVNPNENVVPENVVQQEEAKEEPSLDAAVTI